MSHSGMTNVTFHVDTEKVKKTIQLTVSSDTSLSTLLTQTLLPHLPKTPHTLYDLTLSPPKPVTLTEETDDDVGENSVTLYSLGEDNSNTPQSNQEPSEPATRVAKKRA
mmetsp:Transcript_28847/g.54463  ORF Transcript_28847/g.54463 Transcript_28847/m.54463 type:complete len:109 (-) Transcript_28847:144-470(-)